MKLQEAQQISKEVTESLSPYCERIEIAGSIRRRQPTVHDIDIVLIEKPEAVLLINGALASIGMIKLSGNKIKRLQYHKANIGIDLYFATPATWSTLLLIRTGSKENNIRLATQAKRRGWHLSASGDGLFNGKGERVAGDSEQSIYEALGLPYQEPQDR